MAKIPNTMSKKQSSEINNKVTITMSKKELGKMRRVLTPLYENDWQAKYGFIFTTNGRITATDNRVLVAQKNSCTVPFDLMLSRESSETLVKNFNDIDSIVAQKMRLKCKMKNGKSLVLDYMTDENDIELVTLPIRHYDMAFYPNDMMSQRILKSDMHKKINKMLVNREKTANEYQREECETGVISLKDIDSYRMDGIVQGLITKDGLEEMTLEKSLSIDIAENRQINIRRLRKLLTFVKKELTFQHDTSPRWPNTMVYLKDTDNEDLIIFIMPVLFRPREEQ